MAKKYEGVISFLPDEKMRAKFVQWEACIRVEASSPLSALSRFARSDELKALFADDKKLKRQLKNGAGICVRLAPLSAAPSDRR